MITLTLTTIKTTTKNGLFFNPSHFVFYRFFIVFFFCLFVPFLFSLFLLLFVLRFFLLFYRLCIKTCVVMIPLLGVTWLFGIFSTFHKAFAYIFTIFNSTQVNHYYDLLVTISELIK